MCKSCGIVTYSPFRNMYERELAVWVSPVIVTSAITLQVDDGRALSLIASKYDALNNGQFLERAS